MRLPKELVDMVLRTIDLNANTYDIATFGALRLSSRGCKAVVEIAHPVLRDTTASAVALGLVRQTGTNVAAIHTHKDLLATAEQFKIQGSLSTEWRSMWALSAILSACSNIRDLTLARLKLRLWAVEAIASVVESGHLKHLELLNLASNGLDSSVIAALSPLVGGCKALHTLDLGGNYLGSEGDEDGDEVGHGPNWRAWEKQGHYLRQLTLSSTHLVDEDMASFRAVTSGGSLRELDLSRCKLSGHFLLGRGQGQTLRRLDISHNPITDPMFALSISESLDELFMMDTGVDDGFVDRLELDRNDKLAILVLWRNSIVGPACLQLATNRALRFVELGSSQWHNNDFGLESNSSLRYFGSSLSTAPAAIANFNVQIASHASLETLRIHPPTSGGWYTGLDLAGNTGILTLTLVWGAGMEEALPSLGLGGMGALRCLQVEGGVLGADARLAVPKHVKVEDGNRA